MTLRPGATLGVMGGGQLGRMFVHAAQRLGYRTAVLDPDAQSPAGQVSHHWVRAAYEDPQGLAELARLSDAITTEFENVPAAALRLLAGQRPVSPGADAVAVAQDRAREKAHFSRWAAVSGVSVAPYAVIDTPEQLAAVQHAASSADSPDNPDSPGGPRGLGAPGVQGVAAALGAPALPGTLGAPAPALPGILKTARMGYDGKGQLRVRSPQELADAWASLGRVPCVLEQMLPLAAELSVILARGADGACVHLPVQRNLHRDGILAVTEVYAGNLPPAQAQQAIAATKSIADGLGYVGVLCVEFFLLADGRLVVNEMAPRPHNSGHYSLDACDVSQFELQVRTLAGLPLVQPRLHSPALMLNLLGDIWQNFDSTPPWDAVLALPGVHLHLYGKREAKPGRKMGHLTLTGSHPAQLHATAQEVAARLGLPPLHLTPPAHDS